MMTDDEIKQNCFIPLSQYRINKQLEEDTRKRTKRQQYNHEYYLKVLKPKRQKQRELKGE